MKLFTTLLLLLFTSAASSEAVLLDNWFLNQDTDPITDEPYVSTDNINIDSLYQEKLRFTCNKKRMVLGVDFSLTPNSHKSQLIWRIDKNTPITVETINMGVIESDLSNQFLRIWAGREQSSEQTDQLIKSLILSLKDANTLTVRTDNPSHTATFQLKSFDKILTALLKDCHFLQ